MAGRPGRAELRELLAVEYLRVDVGYLAPVDRDAADPAGR
jgi:hypothetical protein